MMNDEWWNDEFILGKKWEAGRNPLFVNALRPTLPLLLPNCCLCCGVFAETFQVFKTWKGWPSGYCPDCPLPPVELPTVKLYQSTLRELNMTAASATNTPMLPARRAKSSNCSSTKMNP